MDLVEFGYIRNFICIAVYDVPCIMLLNGFICMKDYCILPHYIPTWGMRGHQILNIRIYVVWSNNISMSFYLVFFFLHNTFLSNLLSLHQSCCLATNRDHGLFSKSLEREPSLAFHTSFPLHLSEFYYPSFHLQIQCCGWTKRMLELRTKGEILIRAGWFWNCDLGQVGIVV